MDLIKVGIVGAGTMGAHYARTITNSPLKYRGRVVAVCDSDEARATSFATEIGARPFLSVDDMLDHAELDMVYLAVPDSLHRAPTIACLNAGVPVLVEKPLATTVEDATAIVSTARSTGVPIEVNFSNRWNPPFVRARHAIETGEIGEVIGVNANLSNTLAIPRGIPWAATTTAGWFLLSHVFDLAHWLIGQPAQTVFAQGIKSKLVSEGIDTYDLVQAMVAYQDGASGLYDAAWVLPTSLPSAVDFRFQVIGTEGTIGIDTTNQMIMIANEQVMTYPSVVDWTQSRIHAFFDRIIARSFDDLLLNAGVENTQLLVALHTSLVTHELTQTKREVVGQ